VHRSVEVQTRTIDDPDGWTAAVAGEERSADPASGAKVAVAPNTATAITNTTTPRRSTGTAPTLASQGRRIPVTIKDGQSQAPTVAGSDASVTSAAARALKFPRLSTSAATMAPPTKM
jgi:hypothetical protein